MESGENTKKRDPVEKVLEDFDGRKDGLEEFCRRTKALIDACLEDAQLPCQLVQSRVKHKKKLRDKYLDPRKNYTKLDDITDLAGLRIITYYEDELDRIAEVIKREFNVIPEKSIDKREAAPDKFGYYALNLVCTHSDARKGDAQFKNWATLEFEIQITTVLRHAWSEIEHEWYDLKDAYPDEIKRKFYLLAALLEMAESSFQSLRDRKLNYQRSVDVRVTAEAPDVPIDAVSMKSFLSSEPTVAKLDAAIASFFKASLQAPPDQIIEVRVRLARAAGFKNITDLAGALRQYEAAVLEYVERASQLWGPRPEGVPMNASVSVNYLSTLLIGARGAEPLKKVVEEISGHAPPFLQAQAQIAADVIAKHQQKSS